MTFCGTHLHLYVIFEILDTYTCICQWDRQGLFSHLSFYRDATLSDFSRVFEARTFVAVLCGFFFLISLISMKNKEAYVR